MVPSPTITKSTISCVRPVVGMVALTTYGCGVPREKLIPCNSINIEDVWCAGQLETVKGHQRISASAPEPTNNPRTHRITNARSCSTENTKSVILLLQLSFVIFVQGSFFISGWKVRRSTYAYPGVSNTCVIMRKSS